MNPWTAIFLFACAGAAAAQEVRLSGSAGLGARAVRGAPTPVAVEIDNRGLDREIVLAVTWAASGMSQRGTPTLQSLSDRRGPVHEIPVTLPARSLKRVPACLVAPDVDGASVWAFALGKNGKSIAVAELLTRLVPRPSKLVAIAGSDRPDGLDLPGVETAWIRPENLPEDWKGYEGLEALVWLDGRPSDVRTPAQLDALRTWVSSGGRLVVARAHTVGIDKSAIADLLPVSFKGGREVAGLGALSTLPGVKDSPAGRAALQTVARLRGKIRLEQDGNLLVVEAPHDAGRVTFVAFDPSRAPFAGWADAQAFWAWLLALPPAPPEESGDPEPPPRLLGSSALAQAAGAFPDVAPPAIGGLFLLIVLYLLAVGPVDYFVLRSMKRLELTWITFPAYVLGFTILILAIGGAFLSRAALQREIAVVDHFAETDFCRRRALGSVLAPGDSTFGFTDAIPVSSNFLTRRVSGDYSDELTGVTLARGSPDRGRDWALRRGSTGLLFADRCSSEKPPLSYAVERAAKTVLDLRVDNRTGSSVQEALLIAPGGVFRVEEIAPGESRPKARLLHRDLAAYAADERWNVSHDASREGRHGDEPYNRRGVSEETLNLQARRLLLGLSFSAAAQQGLRDRAGLARSLDALPWIEAGGSVLLVFRSSDESLLRIDPRPTQRTSYAITRFFQGPNP